MTDPLTTIIFVRHGHVHNPEQVFYGRLPRFGLSEQGRQEAKQAGRIIGRKEISAIFTSPLLRARQTARIIRSHNGSNLPLHTSKYLIEAHTPFDGSRYEAMRARNWDLYSGTPAEYEQPADILARSQKFIERERIGNRGNKIVAVTHGDTVAFSLLWALDQPVGAAERRLLPQLGLVDDYPATASLSILSFNSNDSGRPDHVWYKSGSNDVVQLK